jgi:peptide subunit release factor 1 (eRF1)
MKLLSHHQVESLSKFKSEKFLTTSFYLNTDKSRMTKKEIALYLKNLLSSGKLQAEQMEMSREKKESLFQDLDKINRFCLEQLGSYNFHGLAIFSCSGQNFWQLFNLPSPPRNRIIFDQNSYVRPLSAILDEHRRIFALILHRREARWYDIFMGEIASLESLSSDVPSKVREGGFEGYESKRIERHIATHLHDHFKKVAQKTFDLFKKNHFDWLFLGCNEEYRADFEPLLHPYLKSRLKGWLKVMPTDSAASILKESLELEKKLKKEEEGEIVQNFVSELEKGGLAVSGLKNTLSSLNRGETLTLLVTRNFSAPGRICPQCRSLFVEELRCPTCQKKTEKVVDVVDEAVEAAMNKQSTVKHINPPSRLNRYGRIGALLRYKTQ